MFKNILLMLGHQDKFSKKLISHLKKRCKKLSVSYPSSNSKNFFLMSKTNIMILYFASEVNIF